MSFLDALIKRSSETPPLFMNDPALKKLWASWWGGPTKSGQHVNQHNALQISAVYSCVKVIAETLSSLPLITYRRLPGGGKERAVDHPNYRLLKNRPNAMMTWVEFCLMMQAYVCNWGNAVAFIERNRGGQILNLWPWAFDRVRVQMFKNRLWYYYPDPETGREFQASQEEILHIRGMGSDGVMGYSVIALQRESLGLCNAAQEYRARFFANDARPGGVLQHPGELSDTAHRHLRESMQAQFGGDNRRGFAILEEGMQWKDVGVPPNDAQFIEGWSASREEIAGIFRVPPYKIGIMKPGTVSHSSVEQSNLDFWTDCIRFWAVCWEQRLNVALFTETEQRSYFCEFLADAILRSDSKSRAETMAIWRRNGIINANDWLEMENRNPLPGDQGKIYVVESNMVPLDQIRQINDNKAH